MVTGQNGKWVCHKHGEFADMSPEPVTAMDAPLNGAFSIGAFPFPECPTCEAIRKNDICRECEKHPATIDFAESVLAWTHGFTERICKCCHVARIEKHLATVTENLALAKTELAAHPCDPYEPEAL